MHIYTSFKYRFSFVNKLQKQLFIFAILFVTAFQASAQIPLNNDPCPTAGFPGTGAIPLTPTAACTYTTFTNVDSDNSTGTGIPNPTCANYTGTDVWFTAIVPPTATALTVDTRNLVMSDGAMSIYTATGTCPNLTMTEIACIDDGSTNPSMPKLTVNQPAGTKIYIRVWGFGGEIGTFGICVTANIPPPNDNCATAQSLVVNPNLTCTATAAGTTNNATQSTTLPTPTCAAVNAWNDDVWYSFVAVGSTHRVSLSAVAGGSTTMVLTAYSGTCAALTQIGCNVGNTLDLGGLTAGNTYYVRVFNNVTTTAISTFNICVGTPPPPPANDDCLNAVSLTVNPDFSCGVVTAGTTVSATPSNATPVPTCGATGVNDDVWFSFVATSTAHRVSLLNVTGTVTDMAMNIYSGNCTALTNVLCSDPNVANLVGLMIGTTYYVRVYTFTATVGSNASFNICVGTPPPPPSNDNCANAINAPVNPNYLCGVVTPGTITSATPSTGVATQTCSVGGENDDVWFTFTATNATHRINLLNFVGTTSIMTSVIYSGTCATLVQQSCNTTNLYNVTGLIPSQVYYIRIFTTTAAAAQEATFNLCIGTPPPPPANDECIGALPLTVNANQLCGVTLLGSTGGATQSVTTPTPSCAVGTAWDDDVWYTFVAVGNNHSINLLNVNGTTTAMGISVYTGTCASLTQIGCSITANALSMSTLTAGTTYYVRVFTIGNAQDATFNICVGTPGPGAVCASGNPFCSTSGAVYPSVTQQPSLGGGAGTIYGCLGSTPNPTWFAFQVSSPGNLIFQVSQTNTAGTGIDVDYAAWGPFTSQAQGCTQLNTVTPPIQPISCSFSTAALETITIPNAVVGQWYVVLITNFNGGAGTISFNTTTGNVGATNCNIVCNTSANNNGPVCIGGGNFNLTSTTNLTGTVTYSWTGPGGFTSNVQNPVAVAAPTAAGNYVYTLTATSGTISCAASTNLIVVPTPPIPTVVTPITYCLGSTAQPLTATVTTVGNTLVWYTVPVAGVGSATAPIPSTAALGNTTYYVSQKAGLCEGPRTPIVVTIVVNTTPLPVVITPVAYCQNAVATTLASNATAITGASLLWYTTSAGGIGTIVPPTPSTAVPGPTTYYVSQIIGTCESARVPIVVNVTALSPSPTVVSPVNYCVGNTSVALTATGTNLMWYTAPIGGAALATAPVPNTATASAITYYVTQTNASGCASLRVPILVNVFANPVTPIVTTPVVYCQGVTAAVLTAVGTNLTWYNVPVGGVALATAPTPSTIAVGSTTYYVQANNGTCFSTRSAITVTVNATPVAPTVVSPVTYCQGITAIPLTAIGTALTWYVPLGGGTIVTGIAPTPVTTNVGNTTYQVSSTLGTCEGPKSTILVVVNPTPVAPTVVTPVTYCQSVAAVPLTASGTGLLWYQGPIGGVGSAIAPSPSTATGGSTTYYVSSTQGTCEGPRSAITVTVTATPAPPTVTTPVVYCQAATAVPLTATGSSIIYYNTLVGGIGSTTAPTPSTVNVGNTNYYVTQSTSGVVCESPRALIVVTINAKPLAPTVVSPVPYCQTVNAIPLTATGGTGNTFLWYTTPTGVPGTATAPIPSTSTVGSTTYYVSQTTALSCEGPRSPITVNVTPVLTVNAGNDTIMARGNTIQLNGQSTGGVTGVTGATYLWTANISPLALSSATILNPFANPIATTIYTLRATDPSGLCPSVTDNVKIEVVQSCVNVRNAFTPNGDGINDKWFVYDQNFCLSNPGGAKVNVYNRYGSKVFESQNYTNSWDGTYKGKPVPDGTYFAVIEFTLFDGTRQLVRTDVTVIR